MWNFLTQIYEKLRKFIIVTININEGVKTFPFDMGMFVLE